MGEWKNRSFGWCADWFSPTYDRESPKDNPKGPPTGTMRVVRGGSFLCTKAYCNRFKVSARNHNTPDSAGSNGGFRCVADV
ncbi:MAG TPA: SUMF1/EgtB/PvdO family nonheme iron enzyme [Bacilli bacterium]